MESLKPEKSTEKIDFASEKLRYRVLITPDAYKHFPKITDEEMKSHMERFCCLIGTFKVENDQVLIEVEGTLESDSPLIVASDSAGHEVRVDYGLLEGEFEAMKKEESSLSGVFIIGDLHTHPYTKEDLGRNPWIPSSEDIRDMIAGYEDMIHGVHNPYFSAIAARRKGKMALALYRVIKNESEKYRIIPLNDYEFVE